MVESLAVPVRLPFLLSDNSIFLTVSNCLLSRSYYAQ